MITGSREKVSDSGPLGQAVTGKGQASKNPRTFAIGKTKLRRRKGYAVSGSHVPGFAPQELVSQGPRLHPGSMSDRRGGASGEHLLGAQRTGPGCI